MLNTKSFFLCFSSVWQGLFNGIQKFFILLTCKNRTIQSSGIASSLWFLSSPLWLSESCFSHITSLKTTSFWHPFDNDTFPLASPLNFKHKLLGSRVSSGFVAFLLYTLFPRTGLSPPDLFAYRALNFLVVQLSFAILYLIFFICLLTKNPLASLAQKVFPPF